MLDRGSIVPVLPCPVLPPSLSPLLPLPPLAPERESPCTMSGLGHSRLRSLSQKSPGMEANVRSMKVQFCACVTFPRHCKNTVKRVAKNVYQRNVSQKYVVNAGKARITVMIHISSTDA